MGGRHQCGKRHKYKKKTERYCRKRKYGRCTKYGTRYKWIYHKHPCPPKPKPEPRKQSSTIRKLDKALTTLDKMEEAGKGNPNLQIGQYVKFLSDYRGGANKGRAGKISFVLPGGRYNIELAPRPPNYEKRTVGGIPRRRLCYTGSSRGFPPLAMWGCARWSKNVFDSVKKNNTASNVSGVTLFKHGGLKGTSETYKAGHYNNINNISGINNKKMRANDVSSLIIYPGYKVTFYSEYNFKGQKKEWSNNNSKEKQIRSIRGWNDRMRSMKVQKLNTNAFKSNDVSDIMTKVSGVPVSLGMPKIKNKKDSKEITYNMSGLNMSSSSEINDFLNKTKLNMEKQTGDNLELKIVNKDGKTKGISDNFINTRELFSDKLVITASKKNTTDSDKINNLKEQNRLLENDVIKAEQKLKKSQLRESERNREITELNNNIELEKDRSSAVRARADELNKKNRDTSDKLESNMKFVVDKINKKVDKYNKEKNEIRNAFMNNLLSLNSKADSSIQNINNKIGVIKHYKQYMYYLTILLKITILTIILFLIYFGVNKITDNKYKYLVIGFICFIFVLFALLNLKNV